MRWFYLFATLIFWASAAGAESFGLLITIQSRGLPAGELNARLHYSLERASPELIPLSDRVTLRNKDRNEFSQFVFSFDDLNFAQGTNRGFYWGVIEDSEGNTVRRIPLRAFSESDLSDRRLLIADVPTYANGLSLLRESYPIGLPDSRFLDEENVLFSLQAVRTLIDAGFISTTVEWQRVFDKFTANVSFFQRGGADDVGLILRYLHERYEILNGSDATVDIYSKFYFRFLSSLLELEIGGLVAPDGSRLDAYTIGRMRQIIDDQGMVILEQVLDTQAGLIRLRQAESCLQISQAMMLEINADQRFWATIDARETDERNLKVLLKRFVDCAQRLYVQTEDDGASMGALNEGFLSLLNEGEFGEKVAASFFETVQNLENAGLFPQTKRTGPFQQVYAYYNQAIERMGF